MLNRISRRLGTIGNSDFRQHTADIIAHRAFREVQLAGDVGAAYAFAGEAQYLALTSEANRERDRILAEADAEAERIRGRGEAYSTSPPR